MKTNKFTLPGRFLVGSLAFVAVLLLGTPLRSEGHSFKEEPVSATVHPKAPEIIGASENWINTDGKALPLFDPKGKAPGNRVYVLTFWTHQCINCKRTLPYWNDWARRYKGSDVSVVSVHTPETASERVPANVRRFVRDRGILFPVVIDNESKNWNAYKVQAWPTTILIDKQGRIRQRWEGELNWEQSGDFKKVEQAIEALRKEQP